jgi:hypothetical protein
MSLTIEQLIGLDRSSPGPWLVEGTVPSVGGVDPLGLRQINFDLMDRVFPGLNNVARHIRPFTIVAWAWRRTRNLAVERELALPLSTHEDFVARIEVAFVWSLILSEDGAAARDIDLPGKQRVSDYMAGRDELSFGDDEWRSFVKSRRNSTALTAAINYGPGLRAFKILGDDILVPGLRAPYPTYDAALDAFEREFAPALDHPVFNGWDSCSITAEEAYSWQQLWDIAKLTDEERSCFRDRLVGDIAGKRQRGFDLLRESAASVVDYDEAEFRAAMCSSALASEASVDWKRVQVRQLFRLALEALLRWMQMQLDKPISTVEIATLFLRQIGADPDQTATSFIGSLVESDAHPVSLLESLQSALANKRGIESAISTALAYCLGCAETFEDESTREERLPLRIARKDYSKLADGTALDLMGHILESWVLAQNTYWSVGRGLADARAGAKTILRLRIVQEEGGWVTTRGHGGGRPPNATADRLRTAISLATEASVLAAND